MITHRSWTGCNFGIAPSQVDWEYGINCKNLQIELQTEGRLRLQATEKRNRRQRQLPPAEVYAISDALRTKTALLFGGLIPAAIYADALQEEIPEAEWAAQQLREWAKWAEK